MRLPIMKKSDVMRGTLVTIRQSALQHNFRQMKSYITSKVKFMAMVKANAYGHGVSACVPALIDADAYGVAILNEALQVWSVCQDHQIDKPIVIMQGAMSADEWQMVLRYGFECVIHSQYQLEWALNHPPSQIGKKIWLKYNTGMNRLGFTTEQTLMAADRLVQAGYQLVLTSHFACADEPNHPANAEQIARFDIVLSTLKNKYPHQVQGSLCNSAGIIHFGRAHYDWVRSGIALYGSSPVVNMTGDVLGLVTVMQFTTKITATHELKVGESVGYGATWTARYPCRIGVVRIGYGDGYPRGVVDAQVCVLVEGVRYFAPIVGRVAMDMLMIDITKIRCDIGDTVMLWGEYLSADMVAIWANTISYELYCHITTRPTRWVEAY